MVTTITTEDHPGLDPDYGTVKALQPEVDIDRLKGWHTECQSHHGDSCNNRFTQELARHVDHLVLVDVNDGCLRSLPISTPFVALSYVWGQAETTKLWASNLEQLKRPGVLLPDSQELVIPKTIRDAIYLVKEMGESYLWVDCLCVMQDASSSEMHKMLRAMANIYASAEFTIVDAGGSDANYGLPGIRGREQARHWVPDLNSRVGLDTSIVPSIRWPEESVWASRGWTFQESFFSRRLLILEWSVSWCCGRCQWLEEYEDCFPRPRTWPIERAHLSFPMGTMSLLKDIPDLGRWGSSVDTFSSRSFTYEEDVQAAFAGATEIMGSKFPGGMLYGLPEFFFDIALMWRPQALISLRHGLPHRRGQPSWSWTGLAAPVNCTEPWSTYYPVVYKNQGQPSNWLARGSLRPLARWILGTKNVHLNGFYEYQALRESPAAALPDGWSRVEHPRGAFYTHVSNIGHNFPYSYPLPPAPPAAQPDSSTHIPVLNCTAPIAVLSFGNWGGSLNDYNRVQSFYYRNHPRFLYYQQKKIGILTCDRPFSPELVEQMREDSACELVAISQAQVTEEFDWKFTIESRTDTSDSASSGDVLFGDCCDGWFSIYNVLWIEWENGIAYRQGIGFVIKKEWDALEPEVRTFQFG